MYFKNFSFSNLATDNQRDFIEALSKKLEYFNPQLIDFEEVIVFFSEAHQHFGLYSENKEWIIEAVYFVSQILSGKFQIHTFYKGNKVIKVKTYFIYNNREKEIVSSCGYLTLAMLNPLAKAREKMEIVSFFFNNANES